MTPADIEALTTYDVFKSLWPLWAILIAVLIDTIRRIL